MKYLELGLLRMRCLVRAIFQSVKTIGERRVIKVGEEKKRYELFTQTDYLVVLQFRRDRIGIHLLS